MAIAVPDVNLGSTVESEAEEANKRISLNFRAAGRRIK